MSDDDRTGPLAPEERAQRGARLRREVPHAAHAEVSTVGRSPATGILGDQNLSRLQELVPLRHERMAQSPFTFYRGAAAVMAADLARLPHTGITVQLCGDAHLSNFGMFGSPERRLVFDVNDFDETLPGPWEWDLKRLVASLAVAGRDNGYTPKQIRKILVAATQRYQEAMQRFAAMGNLAVWYSHLDVEDVRSQLDSMLDKATSSRFDANLAKTRSRDHLRSLRKLTTVSEGRRRFVADPPLLVPLGDLLAQETEDAAADQIRELILGYAASLPSGTAQLVRSYAFVDMARKVVGVGSVGTRCWVVLLRGRDEDDPLFLQVKEAQPSVLARHLGAPVQDGASPDGGASANQGARVVRGQRLMQSVGDIFLGFHRAVGLDGLTRDFYVRQLHDWKGSADIARMEPRAMRMYGQVCAWTLARAHARSGDRIAIAAYLGEGDSFAEALREFAETYADLTERDHAAFVHAVRADAYLGRAVGSG
jgi:uncharacterized protein (DUF2252 family)